MRQTEALLAAFTGLVSLKLADAYFILQGSNLVHERIDPIVSFGGISSHVHNIVGVSITRYSLCSFSPIK